MNCFCMTFPLLDKLSVFVGSLIPFAVVLSVVVFVHEMGHFLTARHNGVSVKTFSIGFGPELCGWTDRKGTRWKVGILPFGGYVMMLGDEDATSTRTCADDLSKEQLKGTLMTKTPLQRMMVALGGPLFNILFTILLMSGLGLFKGIPLIAPCIQSVVQGTPAEVCGLQEGDVITGLNDTTLESFQEMAQELVRLKGQDVTLHYRRGAEERTVPLSLYKVDENGQKIPVDKLGVRIGGMMTFRKVSVGAAILNSLTYCVEATKASCQMLRQIITRQDKGQMGSILMVGDGAKQSMEQGIFSFLSYMAMLSFSLGFFNLLPIPVLDGGSILLNAIEAVIRRPLPIFLINAVYILGVGIVGLLMLYALWNDCMRYDVFSKIDGVIRGIFK